MTLFGIAGSRDGRKGEGAKRGQGHSPLHPFTPSPFHSVSPSLRFIFCATCLRTSARFADLFAAPWRIAERWHETRRGRGTDHGRGVGRLNHVRITVADDHFGVTRLITWSRSPRSRTQSGISKRAGGDVALVLR